MAKPEKLITAKQAGMVLGLEAKTVLAGKCDTEDLTRVPVGKHGVRFIESEVQALVLQWIARARKEQEEKDAATVAPKLQLVPDADQVQAVFRKFQR